MAGRGAFSDCGQLAVPGVGWGGLAGGAEPMGSKGCGLAWALGLGAVCWLQTLGPPSSVSRRQSLATSGKLWPGEIWKRGEEKRQREGARTNWQHPGCCWCCCSFVWAALGQGRRPLSPMPGCSASQPARLFCPMCVAPKSQGLWLLQRLLQETSGLEASGQGESGGGYSRIQLEVLLPAFALHWVSR